MRRWLVRFILISSTAGGLGRMLEQPCQAGVPTSPRTAVAFTEKELAQIFKLSPLLQLPPDPTNRVADDPTAAHFGQFLFFDKRLSGNGQVSCASCHDPSKNWSDGQPLPSQFGPDLRHVPSLWNVAFNRWFFWDGRSDSLWSQALEPLEHAQEHGGNRRQYVSLVYNDENLRQAYELIFGAMPLALKTIAQSQPSTERNTNPNGAAEIAAAHQGRPRPRPEEVHREDINKAFANLGKTMAAYQRKIISRKSPFDIFVEGLKANDPAQLESLSPTAQRGLKLFVGRANCISCHHGPNFTDGEFHDTGVDKIQPRPSADAGRFDGINALLKNPFNDTGPYCDDPDGRPRRPTWYLSNHAQRKGQFKTPSLRNVAVTPPYMHRGQLATLEEVIRFYSTLRIPGEVDPPPGSVDFILRQAQGGHTHTNQGGEHLLIPLNLSRSESDDLVAFLKSLTDVKIDPALTTQPASPAYVKAP